MKSNISEKQLREFGLLMGIAFPLLIGWLIPSIWGHMFKVWTLWIGIPSLILGKIRPKLLLYPYKLWMAIGHILGWVNSRLILGLVFIFVLLVKILLITIFAVARAYMSQHNLVHLPPCAGKALLAWLETVRVFAKACLNCHWMNPQTPK